jgi:nicotinate-nucleotide pyrophosphorylase (carboxylating)
LAAAIGHDHRLVEAVAASARARADVVMLDNFDDDGVAEALRRVSSAALRPVIEVSGGVTLDRIERLARLGVDVISVGSLTHGARAIDIGLDLELTGAWTTSTAS